MREPRPDKPTNRTKMKEDLYEKQIKGPSEENRMAREVGRRLKPDGFEHVATYCVHVYKPKFGLGLTWACQNLPGSDKTAATINEANRALMGLSEVVARSYGWAPSKRESKIIKEL